MDIPNLPRPPAAAKQLAELPGAEALLAVSASSGSSSMKTSNLPPTARPVTPSIVSAWDEIDAALTPIIGQQGVAALYKRSVHLTARSHPWLAAALDHGGAGSASAGMDSVVGIDTFYGLLMRQDAALAAPVGEEFLSTFYGLLTNLIGASLTERLLHSVWVNFLSDPRQEDTSP